MKNIVRSLTAAVLVISLGSVDAQDARARRLATGNQALDLDGVVMGLLHSAGGGDVSSEVITEILGSNGISKKHIGAPKYGALDLQVGFDMNPGVFQWIQSSWNLNTPRKNGGIHQLDFRFNAVTQRKFFNALITETTIPACDGSVKDPAYITLKVTPELTRDEPSSGNVGSTRSRQKSWNPANFRLMIGGLDCSKVTRVDSFTVKKSVSQSNVGEGRDYELEPGKLEFPNLRITMTEAGVQTWTDWLKDFVINGNNNEANEKTGTLEFLSANRNDVLLTIKFNNLGIFKLAPTTASAKSCDCDLCETVVDGQNSGAAIKRWTAELYCEKMEFLPPSPIIGGD